MICPSCGAAELVHDTRDLPYTYKGATTVFAGIEGDYCPTCGESVHGAEIGDKLSRMTTTLNESGNAAREHLAAGNPIYYREPDTRPGFCIKEYPDGTRELVHFDQTGEMVDRHGV